MRGWRPFAGLPPVYGWLWAGVLVNRLGGLVVPFLALYLTERRGATVAQAGLVVAMWGVGSIGAAPVAGLLADRVGRRATMVGALGFAGAGMMLLAAARSIPVIGAGVLLLGFVGEGYRPAMSAAVADLMPALEDRVRAYALFFWAANLGFAFALTFGGLLASASFTLLFLADGATTLTFAALVAWKVPETLPLARAARGADARPEPVLRGLVAAYHDPVLVGVVALNFLVALMLWQAHATLPIDMRHQGLSAPAYGALMAVNGIVIVLVQPWATGALRARDPARVLALASFTVGLGWSLNALATTPLTYGSAIVLWTLGEIGSTPMAIALVAELAPPDLRGRYQGAFTMSFALAAAVGPVLGAAVLGRFGRGVLWGSCLVLGALVAAAHLALAESRRRRLERGREAKADSPLA